MQQWWKDFQPPQGTPMYKFEQKMKFIKDKIKKRNKEHFGNIHLEKKCIEVQLEDLQRTIMKEGYT